MISIKPLVSQKREVRLWLSSTAYSRPKCALFFKACQINLRTLLTINKVIKESLHPSLSLPTCNKIITSYWDIPLRHWNKFSMPCRDVQALMSSQKVPLFADFTSWLAAGVNSVRMCSSCERCWLAPCGCSSNGRFGPLSGEEDLCPSCIKGFLWAQPNESVSQTNAETWNSI